MKYRKVNKLFPPIHGIRNQNIFESDSGLGIIFTEDDTPKWGWLKHLSISHQTRYPTWEEILEIKERILGDIDCMMVMPKKEDYINAHGNCFHVWQCPEDWGIQ